MLKRKKGLTLLKRTVRKKRRWLKSAFNRLHDWLYNLSILQKIVFVALYIAITAGVVMYLQCASSTIPLYDMNLTDAELVRIDSQLERMGIEHLVDLKEGSILVHPGEKRRARMEIDRLCQHFSFVMMEQRGLKYYAKAVRKLHRGMSKLDKAIGLSPGVRGFLKTIIKIFTGIFFLKVLLHYVKGRRRRCSRKKYLAYSPDRES